MKLLPSLNASSDQLLVSSGGRRILKNADPRERDDICDAESDICKGGNEVR